MKPTILLSLVLTTLLSACAADRPATAKQDGGAAQSDKKADVTAVFFSANDAKSSLAAVKLGDDNAPNDAAAEDLRKLDETPGANVSEACGAKPLAVNANPAAVIGGWVIEKVGTLLVDSIDSALQDELKKYSATITAKAKPIDFYDEMSDKAGLIKDAKMCFRITQRGPTNPDDPKSPPTVIKDFVGVIGYSHEHKEILSIRPVRLYYRRVEVKTKDGKIAVSINLSADVTQRLKYSAVTTAGAINATVLSDTIDASKMAKDGYVYKFYQIADTKPILIPLVPWNYNPPPSLPTPAAYDKPVVALVKVSTAPGLTPAAAPAEDRAAKPDNGVPAHSYFAASITITEMGDVPWLLEKGAALFDKNKAAIGKDLVSAAQKAAGVSSN